MADDDDCHPRGERPDGSESVRVMPHVTTWELSAAPPGEVVVSDLLDGAPVRSAHVTLLAVATLTALFYGYIVQALAFTAPVMAATWAVPSTAFALVFSATLVGMMVGSLLFGSLADRWGKQRVLVLCGLLLGASTLLLPFFGSPRALIAPRLVAGFALGGMLPPLIAIVGEFAPASRRSLFSNVALAGVPLGGLVGSLLSALLIVWFGWPSVYLVAGCGAVVMACLAWRLVPESVEFTLRVLKDRDRAAKAVRRFRPDAPLDGSVLQARHESAADRRHGSLADVFGGRVAMTLLFWVAEFVALMGYYVLVNWVPTLLVRSGLSTTASEFGSAALNLGGVVFGFVVGVMSDRLGARPVMVGASIAGGLTLLLVAATGSSTPLLLFSIFLAGGAWIAGQAGMLVLISSAYPSAVRSFAVGMTLAVGRIGSIVSPAVVAIPLAAGWSTIHILLLPVIPSLIAALCVWGVRPPEERRKPSQSTISTTHARTASR